MDFQDKIYTVGIIDKILSGDHCRVKIVATKDHKNINVLTQEESEELFPPIGNVFGMAFFKNYPDFKQYDLIDLECVRNKRIDEEDSVNDLFMISNGSVKTHFIKTLPISNIVIDNHSIDLNKLQIDRSNLSGDFYGYTSTKIYGKFRFQDGHITAVNKKRIYVWDKSECKIFEYENRIFLLEEPDCERLVLDSMNNNQLFEWFRDYLKNVNLDYVTKLDTSTKWRTKIPLLFKELDEESSSLDKNRLERFEDKLMNISLSIADIRDFVEKSKNLKEIFDQAIERHKEEFKQEYVEKLEAYEIECDEKKLQKKKEVDKIQKLIEEKEHILHLKNNEIKELDVKLENININKERILSDFAIVKDVLSINGSTIDINSTEEDSYILEEVERIPNSIEVNNLDDYTHLLKIELSRYQKSPNVAERIVDLLSVFRAIFINSIELGIAIVESTGEAKFIIQHVEPDWLHFKDFWNNGLGAIWNSAQYNPNILHFLILEDINMSSPECYARPLLDVIRGVRKRIPYAKTVFPENLKILATKASTEEPEIGLKLNKDTFYNWGAIGFSIDMDKVSSEIFKKTDGYLSLDNLISFKPDELSVEELLCGLENEYDNLFDN